MDVYLHHRMTKPVTHGTIQIDCCFKSPLWALQPWSEMDMKATCLVLVKCTQKMSFETCWHGSKPNGPIVSATTKCKSPRRTAKAIDMR